MSQVVQEQGARLRARVKLHQTHKTTRPPLMARSGSRSYLEVTAQPAFVWQIKPGQQHSAKPQTESKSQLIHRRFTEFLTRSTPSHPICLKCGSAGHFARYCRNASLCFICNKFGHKARACTATTLAFPQTPPLKQRNPRSISERRAVFKSRRQRSAAAMVPPLRTPIVTLTPSAESELIETQFHLSFILDDIAGWGPEKIEQIMQRKFRRAEHRWIATVYEEFQYLIRAPTKAWLDSVASRGFLVLEDIEFPVLAWEPDFDDGMDLTPIWLRIRGFPKSQWNWTELERVFNPLGAHLLELDPGTGARYDWRFIRAKFGVCNPQLIPPLHYVERLTPSGTIKVFDISIEIEDANTESIHAWRARLNGRPYPNGTEFGMQQLWDEDASAEQNREMIEDDTEALGQEVHGKPNGDATMDEKPLVQPGSITPGCKPGLGVGRKRDEDDGAAPGSGKKGTVGITPKRAGLSKPSGSGTKPVPKSGGNGSGARPTKKPISPVLPSSPILLSPNTFHALSEIQTQSESDTDILSSSQPLQKTPDNAKHRLTVSPTQQKKVTWGSKKKQSPVTIKKKFSIGGKCGVATRLRSSKKKTFSEAVEAPEQLLPTLTTPAVEAPATAKKKGIVPRKSLRVQAQAGQLSTMSKAVKRVRDKEVGSASSAGHMDKKLKEAAASWLPDDLDAIPLSVWEPNDMQMVVYQPAVVELLRIGGVAGSPAN